MPTDAQVKDIQLFQGFKPDCTVHSVIIACIGTVESHVSSSGTYGIHYIYLNIYSMLDELFVPVL